jgi:tetratricopeptide (TPR) repeat protein
MAHFRPREVFRQAKEAEQKGNTRVASAHYATLAVYLRRKGKLPDALVLIERAIRLSPKSPRLYLQQAICRFALGDRTAAENAIASFARIAMERGKVDEYLPYLETALKDFPVLRQSFYERHLAVDRTTASPFLAQAKTLREQGKLDAAQKALLDALKTKTADAEVIEQLAEVLNARGQADCLPYLKSFSAGKLSRADLVTLLSGTGKPPAPKKGEPPPPDRDEDKNLNSLIRDLEAEIGVELEASVDQVEPLVREFRRRSQKILSGDSKARIDMALAFFEMGLIDDARDELKPVDPADPKYPEAQALLGEILYAEGSDLGALEAYQNCLRDERATVEMIREGKYKLLQIYFRLGDLKQALVQARELQKLVPDYRDLRYLKMRIQEALGISGDEDPK